MKEKEKQLNERAAAKHNSTTKERKMRSMETERGPDLLSGTPGWSLADSAER